MVTLVCVYVIITHIIIYIIDFRQRGNVRGERERNLNMRGKH